MARRGRKRNTTAERHECGKIVQPTRVERREEIRRVGTWNRLKDAVARRMEDPRWGSELGRLHYQGKIFETQREAGERLLRIVTEHRQYGIVIDGDIIPLPKAKVSKLERSIPGSRHEDEEKVKRAQDAFDRVFAEVIDMGREGVSMWKTLMKLCVEDEVLTYQELTKAKRGLDRVAVLLGLTGVAKFPKKKLDNYN